MSNATTTGLDLSSHVGCTITAVTYEVPGHYGYSVDGVAHEALSGAIEAAIKHYHDLREMHARAGGQHFLPEHLIVDQRVRISRPDGGSTEMVAQRITFPTLADATERLGFINHRAAAFGA